MHIFLIMKWKTSAVFYFYQNGNSPPPGSVQELEDYLEGLTLNLTEENLEDIMTLSQSMTSEDDLKNVAKRIYEKSLKDQEFSKCGACICDRLANIEVQGSKFRNVILKFVQEDFKGNFSYTLKSILKRKKIKSKISTFKFVFLNQM